MHKFDSTFCRRFGHSLMELVVAMVASAALLAGLGSVMMIARQTALSPSAGEHRVLSAQVVSSMADELRYATLILQRTPRMLEFVVADRDGDGAAERIRYDWSGVSGSSLEKTVNGEDPIVVLANVEHFQLEYTLAEQVTTLETTVDTAEQALLSSPSGVNGEDREITRDNHIAQYFEAAAMAGRPANAVSWNATKVVFYGDKADSSTELFVQLRAGGDSASGPTSLALSEVVKNDTSLASGRNEAVFPAPVRGLALNRSYALAWCCEGNYKAAKLRIYFDQANPIGSFESINRGASWRALRKDVNVDAEYGRMHGELWGSYTVPGPPYNLRRKFLSHVRVTLNSALPPQDDPGKDTSHARIEASVPLANRPELLSAYWRADFSGDPQNDIAAAIDPTAADSNGDAQNDWEMGGGETFDVDALADGVWTASGQLQTLPANDFAGVTIVEARCRNGAIVSINADRLNGTHAPLTVRIESQSDGSQTLALLGQPTAGVDRTLCRITGLVGDLADARSFVPFRLIILPEQNLVNLHVNGEDQGTFSYPIHATASNDRFLSLSGDGAEFDDVEVRVSEDTVVEQL
jgi:hypothetical protein